MRLWFDGDRYHRKSIRLADFDYSRAGAYFITLRVEKNMELLGCIDKYSLRLSDAGRMIVNEWKHLRKRYINVIPDEFIVMPDHFHGILFITPQHEDLSSNNDDTENKPNPTLSRIMQSFKSITTVTYMNGVRNHSWPEFDTRLWQHNYFDRIIKNDNELNILRQYIHSNPRRRIEKLKEADK